MSVGKLCEFNVVGGAWSSYVDRLEMFFLVNTVPDNLKLPTLISVMGDEAYELLANLASPKKPSELVYKEAVDLLRHHLQPAPSVLAERYRFRQRRQNSVENVATYVAELKKLARNCKFGTSLNENLRDQFVCGLRSDVIRQRLFAEDDTLVYSNAVKIASSLEAAERDAAAVEPSSGTGANGAGPAFLATVHSLAPGVAQRNQARSSRSMTNWRSKSTGWSGRGSATNSRTASRGGGGAGHGPGAGGDRRNCGGCGAMDHDYVNCRFRDYVCSWCHRREHLRRVCAGRGEYGRGGSAPGRLHYGQAQAAEDSDRDERPTEEDFHHLCLNDYGAI